MRASYMHATHAAGFTAFHPPGGGVVAAMLVAFCLLAFAVTVMLIVTAGRYERGDGRDGDPGPEGGGGGPGGGGPDHPRPSGEDPVWWPEFERQFADYVTATYRS
jgi:hypothetical protein